VPERPVELLGLTFKSPIGIAAGFDKNATMMPFLAALGFGFLEVGTVTPRPQPGNPRPRLFRDPARRALVNRMGFNNDGADAVAERLRSTPAMPPLFVNIGKNKSTPLDRAVDDYAICAKKLGRHSDAIVINVSSPNTPALRELQRPEHLSRILDVVEHERVFVKIAPDVDDVLLGEIVDVCVKRASGMICTNTMSVAEGAPHPAFGHPLPTSGERGHSFDPSPRLRGEGQARSARVRGATRQDVPSGGLSGGPLFAKSTEILAKVRQKTGPGYPLIGVGGIFTADDVRAKMAAGADLVQLYTSLIYEGPRLPSRLARER
jgi:dihydroorotate dehydrogenase